MLSFANPTLPEFSDDLLIAPAVEALQGLHGKPNTFSSYTTRRDTAHATAPPNEYHSRQARPEIRSDRKHPILGLPGHQ